jgi:hypothetical protein
METLDAVKQMQLLGDGIVELEHDNVRLRLADCGQRVTGIAYDYLAEPFTLFEQFCGSTVRGAQNPLSTQRGSQTITQLRLILSALVLINGAHCRASSAEERSRQEYQQPLPEITRTKILAADGGSSWTKI